MECAIKIREQKTIVAENFKDYNRQMDVLKATLHPGEKLVVATQIIGIAVIIKTAGSSGTDIIKLWEEHCEYVQLQTKVNNCNNTGNNGDNNRQTLDSLPQQNPEIPSAISPAFTLWGDFNPKRLYLHHTLGGKELYYFGLTRYFAEIKNIIAYKIHVFKAFKCYIVYSILLVIRTVKKFFQFHTA